MKEFVLKEWAKYNKRYGVRFIDFNIMDNHVHAIVKIRSVTDLGNFMRVVNSRIALEINKVFDRDSHALRERYKSPKITSTCQMFHTIAYVWHNRIRVGGIRPDLDRFCSYYYRNRGFQHPLVESYRELGLCDEKDELKFTRRLYQDSLKELLLPEVFEHSHTIGDLETVIARGIEISAKAREMRLLGATAPP